MAEKVSVAAGRVVEHLSRRRFLAGLGAGGAALATGLGLEHLRSAAFARGVACHRIQLGRHVHFRTTSVAACVPAGQCGSQQAATKRAIAEEVCFRSFAAKCEPGEHCGTFEQCRPTNVGGVDGVRVIHCSGAPDDRCHSDEVLCTCEEVTFARLACDCKCCRAIGTRRPGQACE